MELTWHGYSCFSIKTKNANIIIDPYSEGLGIKLPSLKGDAVLISKNEKQHNNPGAVGGEPRIIDWPGEYEVKGAAITAIDLCTVEGGPEIKAKECKTENKPGLIFTIEADELRVCFIGDMGKEVSDELIDNIGDVDILLIPVGGEGTLDAKQAQLVIEKIEPRAVVPMHYKISGIKEALDDVEPFLKAVGAADAAAEEKLVIKAKTDFPEDKTVFAVLKPKL
jgi:L-ascorbate metabolism protein UlaG (beta-lactamase superfamily)